MGPDFSEIELEGARDPVPEEGDEMLGRLGASSAAAPRECARSGRQGLTRVRFVAAAGAAVLLTCGIWAFAATSSTKPPARGSRGEDFINAGEVERDPFSVLLGFKKPGGALAGAAVPDRPPAAAAPPVQPPAAPADAPPAVAAPPAAEGAPGAPPASGPPPATGAAFPLSRAASAPPAAGAAPGVASEGPPADAPPGADHSEDQRCFPPSGGAPPSTLWCYSLMIPTDFYERSLIEWQFGEKVSIFACDGYAVYSSEEIEITDELVTAKVDSDLKCEKGGEFGTALNVDIFYEVWKKVVDDAYYAEFDWTVKADPDAVFFPERLKAVLEQHPIVEGGLYLVNCPRGLHGPVEVISREAVERLFHGWDQCTDSFLQMCSGDCEWGEDMFADQCLSKVLGVRCEHDDRLLIEDACDPPPGWLDCPATLGDVVSIHPFKTPERYEQCMTSSNR